MASQHQELLTACADGDIIKVRDAISSLRQPGTTDVPVEEMAREAAEKGHAAVIEICINEELDINDDWEVAGDMLINAVWEKKFKGIHSGHPDANGPYEFTKWLLEHGADPNSGHLLADSTSAIGAAAQQGRIDLAELLVKHGSKVSGTGALAGASGNKHPAMVQWLLDHGADIDEIGVHGYGDRRKGKDEGTALHKAMANGDVETARLLVGRGADLEIKDPMGRTPSMRALEEKHDDAAAYVRSIERTG